MKYLNIKELKEYKDFWCLELKDINVVFSNAKNERSFNRSTEEGIGNLLSLKEDFLVDEVQYLRQVHSNDVFTYRKGADDFIENEGDGIITNEKNTIIGAFTADCVPVILVDEESKVISAIHSGWKGSFNHIVVKSIEKMQEEFNVDIKNVKAFIGPHIRQCCYEVSEELKEKFESEFNIKEGNLFNGRNLSMEKCIENDLINIGIKDENIYSLPLCTHCEDKEELFSYRKSNGTYGRLFSFVYMK